MPIKASYCDAFYEACKDDYFCSCLPEDGCSNPLGFFSVANVDDCSAESGRCNTFADTFADAKELCEQMWDGAFIYEPEEDTAYTMSWEPGTPNPNNQVNLHVAFPDPCPGQDFPDADEVCGEEALRHPDIIPHACELCTVRNNFTGTPELGATKVASTSEEDLGPCSAWNSFSCCTPEAAEEVISGALYGSQSNVNRCYDNEDLTVGVSELCKRWFIAESCLYECDVSVGKYRRYDDCEPLHW